MSIRILLCADTSSYIRLFLCLCVCYLTGCATNLTTEASLAKYKQDSDFFTSRVWRIKPAIINVQCHSFENDAVMRLAPDGTGSICSRRFGYTQPNIRIGSLYGCGAYYGTITWRITWKPTGKGRMRLYSSELPSVEGKAFINPARLSMRSAALEKGKLVVRYSDCREIYEPIDRNDRELEIDQSDISKGMADWARKGPGLLAATASRIAQQQTVNAARPQPYWMPPPSPMPPPLPRFGPR